MLDSSSRPSWARRCGVRAKCIARKAGEARRRPAVYYKWWHDMEIYESSTRRLSTLLQNERYILYECWKIGSNFARCCFNSSYTAVLARWKWSYTILMLLSTLLTLLLPSTSSLTSLTFQTAPVAVASPTFKVLVSSSMRAR